MYAYEQKVTKIQTTRSTSPPEVLQKSDTAKINMCIACCIVIL